MKNWTKAIDMRVDDLNKSIISEYRTVTVPSTSADGKKVTKKIMFTKDTPKLAKGKKRASLDDSFDMMQQEQDHKKENGTEVLTTKLHPEIFAQTKMMWTYNCVPVPNSTDPLSYMVFAKQIQDALMTFGPQSLNVKRLKHRFAQLTGQDYDEWFLSEQELQSNAAANPQPDPNAPGAPGGASKTGAPGVIPGKPTPAGPSIASAVAGGKPAMSLAGMMQ